MKRLFAALLALTLVLTAGVPALAETDKTVELTAVTQRVVTLLDVSEEYTEFTGNYNDGPQPGWDLHWSREGEELSVRCTAEGVITGIDRWTSEKNGDRFYGFDPAFPPLTEAEARRQAQGWIKTLAGEEERGRIDAARPDIRGGQSVTVSGRILKNGLESPVTFRLTLDANGIRSYERSDAYRGYVGELPGAKAAVNRTEAASALAAAVELELYYVTDGDEARLRYVPVGPYTVVEAQTGETVDMDALYAGLGGWPMIEAPAAMEAAMDAGSGRGLTEVELSSIANYDDVLDSDSLDGAMRAIGDLGLADFALSRCGYSMDLEGEITASLRYTCEMTADNLFGYSLDNFWQVLDWGDTPMVTKYITVNAKTGELLSVFTNYPLWEKAEARTPDAAAAERFLQAVTPDRFAESALCTLQGYNEGEELTYARMHEGYFFPENYLRVTLNPTTNTVDSYDCQWEDDQTFAPAAGIIDQAAALAAYTDALTVTLGYTAWPEAIDYSDPILYAWADWGYSYVESLRLAYYYDGLDAVSGVDALTGQPVRKDPGGGFVYADLAGSPYQAQIRALADCGIGLPGTAFEPERKLTMEDAARLLLSSAGYDTEQWDDEELRDEAVWEGFITAAQWRPEKTLTQEEFIVMIVGASRYGDAARLDGIGFEAVAKALGMIPGAMPKAPCTRADATSLLYRFMKR